MNSNDTNKDGWPATEMRTYVNNDIYNALPSDLKKNIIDTTVISGHGSDIEENCRQENCRQECYDESSSESSGESSPESSSESSSETSCNTVCDTVCDKYEQNDNFTSTDKLYLLSTKEIYGKDRSMDTVSNETRQLDYYKENGVTDINYKEVIKKSNNSKAYWWLRSAYSFYSSYYFLSVTHYGDGSHDFASSSNGISPAFRIG